MILFQAQIQEHQQLAEHYRELAAKREALAAGLLVVQQQADSDLSSLKQLVDKCKEVAPSAIASLKSAVLTLFADGDGGNDGGNQPTNPTPDDPTPRTHPHEAEQPQNFTPGSTLVDEAGSYGIVIGTNNLGMRVDWLGLGNCPNPAEGKGIWYNWAKDNHAIASLKRATHERIELLSTEDFLQFQGWKSDQLDEHWGNEWFDVGVGCQCKWGGATINRWIVVFAQSCEWSSPFASPIACLLWEDAPLLNQHCQLTSHWEHDWELEPLDGQSWEIATPLCCLLFDAPQHNKNKSTTEAEGMAYIELVAHSENKAIAYQRKHDGEIVCVYVGFRTKAIAQSWMHFIEAVTDRVELRQALRMQGFKWELKIKGMGMKQLERLVNEPIDKAYRTEVNTAVPPTYKPRSIPQPVNPDEVGKGDIVTQLLTPSHSYRVEQVMPNRILDCTNLTTGDRLGIRPGAVTLVQRAEHQEEPEADTSSILEVGDIVEVLEPPLKGEVGTVTQFNRYNELPLMVRCPGGEFSFKRQELKFISRPEHKEPEVQVPSIFAASPYSKSFVGC